MKLFKLWGIFFVVVVLGVSVWHYIGQRPFSEERSAPIKIGLSSPMTGEAASIGEGFAGGAELAVQELNDAGGINGRKVELIIEDDACSTREGVSAITKLVSQDTVDALVGPVCSSAAGASVKIAQDSHTPTLLIASAPGLTRTGDYIFRIYPSDALQGKYAAEFVYTTLGARRVAVVYVKNDWGEGNRAVFGEYFKKLGGTVVFEEGVVQDATDLRTQLSKVKAQNVDALYFPVYTKSGIAGSQQAKELGIDVPIIGGDIFSAEEMIQSPSAEGIYYVQAQTPNNEVFNQRLKTITGRSAHFFSVYAYDGVKILAQIMAHHGTERKAVRDALTSLSYTNSISAPQITFDTERDLANAAFSVKLIHNGTSIDYVPE